MSAASAASAAPDAPRRHPRHSRQAAAALRVGLAVVPVLGLLACADAVAPDSVPAGAMPSARSGYAVDVIAAVGGVADSTRRVVAGAAP